MKRILFLLGFSMLFMGNTVAYATFTSGSTGADGPFNPAANIEVVLPSSGVLNYTTVNIPTGVTVTFKKNAANTPVFMLATGDVTIAGTINVAGSNGSSTVAGKGGPGGLDGGYGGAVNASGGKALGPGGGIPGITNDSGGSGGGFGSNGNNGCATGGYGLCNWTIPGGSSYGTANLIPLIGGSGGGGGAGNSSASGGSGGGGGGAIVIASSTLINVTGSITANGGNGANVGPGDGGGGSGAAVKLVAEQIKGNGAITANGGSGGDRSGNGAKGRIRLEATINERTASTSPAYAYGLPTSVFPTSIPSLNITSVAGTAVPASPAGSYNQPDILLPSSTGNPVSVNISAANIPVGTTTKVWVIPQYGSATSVDAILSGTDQSSTATANVSLSTTFSNIVTAEATFTIIQAMYWNGEEIDKVKVATRMGGGSETVYITRSGKEIPGDLIAGAYQ